MIKVYQTRFGGENSPKEKQGNCAQACIASLLELLLEETFDITLYDDRDWYDHLANWLHQRGYHMICFPYLDVDNKPLKLPGYYIVGGKQKASGTKHVVIASNGELVHDPLFPDGGISEIEPTEIWLIYPLNPVRLVNLKNPQRILAMRKKQEEI
jgi:hypothetical protein